MHEMMLLLQTIAVSVCQSVCLSRGTTRFHRAKTAEQIKILFAVNTPWGPRNIVLDGRPDPPQRADGNSMQLSPNHFGLLMSFCSTGRTERQATATGRVFAAQTYGSSLKQCVVADGTER